MPDRAGDVVITSAGRRVQLVRYFQRALERHRVAGRVVVTEADPAWSAAARVADSCEQAPRVDAPGYPGFIVDLVRRRAARMIVPTIDTELLGLARLRTELESIGCMAVVSDASLVETCRDKRLSDAWFCSLGFDAPKILDRSALHFPCFVKPYDGSLSRGARALLTPESVSPDLLSDEKLIFMEWFSPAEYDEYTVDAFYGHGGDLLCVVPRLRVEVRGGEISKGVAQRGRFYEVLLERLRRVRGARGCLTFQFFASRLQPRWVAIEVNPRFGGGYPLSQAAGVDYPDWLVREHYLGERLDFFDGWRERTAMTRFDDEVIFQLPGDR